MLGKVVMVGKYLKILLIMVEEYGNCLIKRVKE